MNECTSVAVVTRSIWGNVLFAVGVVLTVVSFSFSKAAIINKTLQREEQNAKKFSLFLSLFLSSSDEAFKQRRW